MYYAKGFLELSLQHVLFPPHGRPPPPTGSPMRANLGCSLGVSVVLVSQFLVAILTLNAPMKPDVPVIIIEQKTMTSRKLANFNFIVSFTSF